MSTHRASFTASDIEALLAALYRLSETYDLSLSPTDQYRLDDMVEYLTDRNIIPLGDSIENSPVWNTIRAFGSTNRHPRQDMVNFLGVLYVTAFGKNSDEPCNQVHQMWAYGMYSAILETLNIELI